MTYTDTQIDNMRKFVNKFEYLNKIEKTLKELFPACLTYAELFIKGYTNQLITVNELQIAESFYIENNQWFKAIN